jgi:hypothetical protein
MNEIPEKILIDTSEQMGLPEPTNKLDNRLNIYRYT